MLELRPLRPRRFWSVPAFTHFPAVAASIAFRARLASACMRGHGNSEGKEKLRWTRIVDDVVNTVQLLPNPPVLIGHSMGGFIIQQYLENHTSPAAVLLSSAPSAGFSPTAHRVARRQPLIFAKVNLTLSLFPLVANPGLAREAFFSEELTDQLLRKYWDQMHDDSYRAFLDMAALDLPKPTHGKVPLLVLGAERDNMLKSSEIEATARAYHTQAEIIPNVTHNSMLEVGWQAVAEQILDWLISLDY